MAEPKDQGIKLFGRTIPLPEVSSAAHTDASFDESIDLDPSCSMDSSSSSDKNRDSTDGEERACGKDILGKKPTETKQKDGSQPEDSEESSNPDATAEMSENHKLPSNEKEKTTSETSKTEEEHSEPSTSQDKTLKKPDKILPCPRCNSMDTKFCYYNNYNVNQPRHFCKNCQRYWTAGGTMRNVPVGAGRRKSKNSANQYRHITVSEALQNGQTDVPHVVHLPPLKTNGTVLTFGSDAPLCESVASVLNIADKTMRNCSQNGFHKPEKLQVQLTGKGGENGHADSNGSSMTVSNSNDEGGKIAPQEAAVLNDQGFPPQMLCYPVAPWPYPWTSAQWASPSPAPSPAFCPLGFPMPFYPAATYWGTMPGTCWIPQPSSPRTPCSGPNTPTLGKHSRDENMVKQSNSRDDKPHKENYSERCLWIPKTLRIDDPGEAAKSSIWRTLGIKNDKTDSIGGGGLFKAFQPKGNEKNHVAETFPVLQANPAALSRSIKFQESS